MKVQANNDKTFPRSHTNPPVHFNHSYLVVGRDDGQRVRPNLVSRIAVGDNAVRPDHHRINLCEVTM